MKLVIAQRATLAHVRGGMEMQANSLATGLADRGHDVLILTTPHPVGQHEELAGQVRVRYISPGSPRRYDRSWWSACYRELAQLKAAGQCDLLLSQSAGALGYLPRVKAELGLPTVVLVHGTLTGALRTHWRGARSLRGGYRLLRLLASLPEHLVLWRRAARTVDHWITVSHEVAAEWQRELCLPSERVITIPNGIDSTRFRPDAQTRQVTRARLGLPQDAPVLLAVGRLEQEKGFQVAIEALRTLRSHVPEVRLLIAGEGTYRPELERLATGLENSVSFLGYIPNPTLPDFLAAADIFLMPTLCHEAFPMTIVEAMGAGLPVVASRAGGIPTAVVHGQTGFLVPLGNAQALAESITPLLRDPALRASMAAAARTAALAHFSREHMITATEQVLLEAIHA